MKRCDFIERESQLDKIKLQISDIRDYKEFDEDQNIKYKVKIFGVTKIGSSVVITVNGFRPYFYIEVPSAWENDNTYKFAFVRRMNELLKRRTDNPACIRADDISYETGINLRGYSNKRETTFMKISFDDTEIRRFARNVFYREFKTQKMTKKMKMQVYEYSIDPVLKFIHETNIEPSSWILIKKKKIKRFEYLYGENEPVQIRGEVNYKNIHKLESKSVAPFIKMGFDIECYSKDDSFPQWDRPSDKIIQIGSSFKKEGEEKEFLETMYTLKRCDPIKGVYIRCFKKESSLILAWAELVRSISPEVIHGYNTNGFDWNYIYRRAEKLKVHNKLLEILSKQESIKTKYVEKKLVSSGLGDNLLQYIDVPGILNIDILPEIRKLVKLPSYKLKSVLKFYGLEAKIDLSPNEIFDKFKGGKPEDIKEIAVYCCRDVSALHDLFDHKQINILQTQQSMSNISLVPLSYLFIRGQGIKFMSLLSKECSKLNIKIPEIDKKKIDKSKFEGAIVLEPHIGIHDEGVAVIDFNSLYPTIIIAYNLSHDTQVEIGGEFDNLPGKEYRTLEYRDANMKTKEVRFVKAGRNKEDMGIMALMSEKVLNQRKKTKKLMKAATDPKDKSRFNSKQLAEKLTGNSFYGQLGSNFSNGSAKNIAAVITATGRRLICLSKQIAEEIFGAKVVYGDSVTHDTPVIYKINDSLYIREIGKMVEPELFVKIDEKEYHEPLVDIYVYSDQGYTKVRRIIRHKCEKKIYKVVTTSGIVTVTEDHSLLNENGEEISVLDTAVGNKLLTQNLDTVNSATDILNAEICGEIYSGFNDTQLLIENTKMLTANKKSKKLFMGGYLKDKDKHRIEFDSQVKASTMYMIMRSLDKNVSVSYSDNKIILEEVENEVEPGIIKEIIELGTTEEYVYDFETENHHFSAGVGNLVVHNTDSIFIKFNLGHIDQMDITDEEKHIMRISESKRLSDLCAEMITKTIDIKPIAIEYEKVYKPWISLKRKMYVGNMYEYSFTKYKYKEMGVSFKKRDYAPIVADVCGNLTKNIMKYKNLDKAVEYIKERLEGILQGKEKLEQFVITKALRSEYKNPESIAHKVLADRMTARDPGNAPRTNDRLEFIFVKVAESYNIRTLKSGKKTIGALAKKLAGDRIEHVDYVRKHNLEIDYAHYLTNQLYNSIYRLIQPLGGNAKQIINELIVKDYFDTLEYDIMMYVFEAFEKNNVQGMCDIAIAKIKKKVYEYRVVNELI